MNFQILCLSGGGYLGLYTVSILAELERRFGHPIASRFDLIAGTSVGGIIALGLAAEKPADDIKAAFEQNGESIFSSRPAPETRLAEFSDFWRSFFRAKYNGKALRKVITQLLGGDTLIGDLKHPVVIPAVNLTKGKPQVFKTAHHQTFKIDHSRKVVDVALATSAAPTYFPIATIGDELFADGGLYANSPDLIALHEAEHFFRKESQNISLLSIGTTTSKFSFSHKRGLNLGTLAWAQRLPQALLASQQLDVKYMLEHKLGDRYVRVDADQSREQERDLALDVANEAAQKTIRGLASSTVQEIVNHPTLNKMMAYQASPPIFYYGANANAGVV